ncbi:hypothetical protein GCM10009647_003940 [Streptomyces sanglieri]
MAVGPYRHATTADADDEVPALQQGAYQRRLDDAYGRGRTTRRKAAPSRAMVRRYSAASCAEYRGPISCVGSHQLSDAVSGLVVALFVCIEIERTTGGRSASPAQ